MFNIPDWPYKKYSEMKRFTHVVEGKNGKFYLIDTWNYIIEPKRKGQWNTTIREYNPKRARDIMSGDIPKGDFKEVYVFKWEGMRGNPPLYSKIDTYSNEKEARRSHINFCINYMAC